MKTLITVSALALVSNIVLASSWEDNWQNPDLQTGVYNKPLTLVEPQGKGDFTVSLDGFNRGNPDHSAHDSNIGDQGMDADKGYATSLDRFGEGNPDHV